MCNEVYCRIMNQIRKMARDDGRVENETMIGFTLASGETFHAEHGSVELHAGYIEAWTTNENYIFVPIENVLAIRV